MKTLLLKSLNKLLSLLNLKIVNLKNFKIASNLPSSFYLYSKLSKKYKKKVFNLLEKSKSQLAQDIFVVANTTHKKNNFFVEFGATDGITISNTYLLEKELNWKGILIEPASIWHKNLIGMLLLTWFVIEDLVIMKEMNLHLHNQLCTKKLNLIKLLYQYMERNSAKKDLHQK